MAKPTGTDFKVFVAGPDETFIPIGAIASPCRVKGTMERYAEAKAAIVRKIESDLAEQP